MLTTPLHARHVALGGRMVPFAGWDMPVQYTTITEEHRAVRTAAGLFDIGHMGRLRVKGPDAVAVVDRLVTCRVADMPAGRIRYGLVTDETGGILDDVLVYRSAADVGLVVNASNRERIVAWIDRLRAGSDVRLDDLTTATAMIAVQGPAAATIVEGPFPAAGELKYYRHSARDDGFGAAAVVSRTGYTGEDGFELVVPAAEAVRLWDRLLDAGRDRGLVPCGLGCRDTLRLEAGMPLYGHELTEAIDPVTAGLAFAVDLDKPFVGRDAVAAVAARGPNRLRVGLELDGKRIAREGTPLFAGDDAVGLVTSGTFSPTLGRSLAMGYVAPAFVATGTRLEAEVRGRREPARVVPLPFYRRGKAHAE